MLFDMRAWMLLFVLIGCTDPDPVRLGPGTFRVVDSMGVTRNEKRGWSIAGRIDGGVGIGFINDNVSSGTIYCSEVMRDGWTTIKLTDRALAKGTVAVSATFDPAVASASIGVWELSDETGTVEVTDVGDAIVGSLNASAVHEVWGPVRLTANFNASCWR
jgi:hypothetical protein